MSVAAPATLLRRTEWSRHASRLVVVGVFVAAGAAAWSFWPWLSARLSARSPAPPSAAADGPTARVALVPDRPDTVRVPKSLFATGRFATAAAE
ncbi:MAG TPA: hypothetical protein VKE74_24430, partial [Gemmataceae bacterium]|nr:hypothetical protein [Gemmataceae bacterium]